MDSFFRYVYVLSRSPKTLGSLYYRREEEVDMMIQRKRNLILLFLWLMLGSVSNPYFKMTGLVCVVNGFGGIRLE